MASDWTAGAIAALCCLTSSGLGPSVPLGNRLLSFNDEAIKSNAMARLDCSAEPHFPWKSCIAYKVRSR